MRSIAVVVLILAHSLLQISCSDSSSEHKSQYDSSSLVGTQEIEPPIQQIYNLQKITDIDSIDWSKIKMDAGGQYTYGRIARKSNLRIKAKVSSNHVLGIYYLTDSSSTVPFSSKAIVVSDISPQNIYNEEELLEYTIYSNRYNPFVQYLFIGQDKEVVAERFGNHYFTKDSCNIYCDSVGNCTTIYFANDKIAAIRVGLYSNVNDIEPIILQW